jgi:hypothetical protein
VEKRKKKLCVCLEGQREKERERERELPSILEELFSSLFLFALTQLRLLCGVQRNVFFGIENGSQGLLLKVCLTFLSGNRSRMKFCLRLTLVTLYMFA